LPGSGRPVLLCGPTQTSRGPAHSSYGEIPVPTPHTHSHTHTHAHTLTHSHTQTHTHTHKHRHHTHTHRAGVVRSKQKRSLSKTEVRGKFPQSFNVSTTPQCLSQRLTHILT